MTRTRIVRGAIASGLVVLLCCACVMPAAPRPIAPHQSPSEEDIRAAVEATPSATAPYGLAFFGNGVHEDIDVQARLEELHQVTHVEAMPQRFVGTGEHGTPASLGSIMSDLRMTAAQQDANLLLAFDYTEEVESHPNGWYATSILLIPLFATPWLTQKVAGKLDWYLVDVETGTYLARGHFETEQTSRKSTIYRAAEHLEQMSCAHQRQLVDRVTSDLSLIFATWQPGRAEVVLEPRTDG